MPNPIVQNRQETSRLLYVVGIIILLTAVWLWWHNLYMNPTKVFWKAMGNNLSTVSVTKHVYDDSQGQTIDQYTQLQFGSQNASRSLVTITQTDSSGKSQVQSESIGTLANDYSRYVKIESPEKGANGQPLDFSKVVGIWGKSADSDQPQTAYFRQAALNSVVAFGWLNPPARQALIDSMQTKHVYDVSYDNVQKKQENGHTVYVYNVAINPQAYIAMLQQYVQKLGLDVGGALDPTSYQDVPPVKAEFSVDAVSRKLTKIHYVASNRDEEFTSYGLNQPIALPGQTVPIDELQNRLQTL